MSRTFGLLDLSSARSPALLYGPRPSAPRPYIMLTRPVLSPQPSYYADANGISAKLKQVN